MSDINTMTKMPQENDSHNDVDAWNNQTST
jgi:hypothetical protein